MKIALVSSVLPFVNGGYRNIVNWLAPELEKAGHNVETIWLPFDDSPDQILPQMTIYRLLRLEDSCDRIITFRPPAHVIQHPQKVVWFIHHLRIFFDLWGSVYCPFPNTPRWLSLRDNICAADTQGLREASAVFSNSRIVGDRLRRFNGIDSQVLYPPISNPERFYTETCGDHLALICRIEHHKRQHLAIEAMKYTKTDVRLRICGVSYESSYLRSLQDMIGRYDLGAKVTLEDRWISEDEKVSILANALANVYLPLDEDSYGYPTLEAAHAGKATVTVKDSGGVAEFVINDQTGLLVEPDPRALADAFDRLWTNRPLAKRLGESARTHIDDLEINWNRVVSVLTSQTSS